MVGLGAAVWADQAEFLPAVAFSGRILETRAGKSSSWNEEVFFGWAEYAGVIGVDKATAERLGKSSSFKAVWATVATAGAGFTLKRQKKVLTQESGQ